MVDEVLTAGVCMVRVHAYIFKKCNRILFLKRKEKKSWIPKDKICILLCSPLLSYILHWILFKIYSALQCMVVWSQQWDAPACPSPTEPEISLTRAKYESTPQKSRCHVRSHHSPDRSVHACIQIRRGPTWRNEIPVDRDDPGWLLRVRCRNGAKKRTLTRSHSRTFGLCA